MVGDIYIYNHPIGKEYKWYISGIYIANWVMKNITYHLLWGTIETTIDLTPWPFLNIRKKKPSVANGKKKPSEILETQQAAAGLRSYHVAVLLMGNLDRRFLRDVIGLADLSACLLLFLE